MSRKKLTAAGPPVFIPRKRFDDIEAFLKSIKSTRQLVAESVATMRAAADKALAEPDTYNTHEPARVVLDNLETLAAALDGPEEVLRLVHAAQMAAQAFTELRVNAELSETVNQVRNRNIGTAKRPKAKPLRDPAHIRKVLARHMTVTEEMAALRVKRSTIDAYRKKYGTQKSP